MCDICDGTTYDQLAASTRGHIERAGWAVQQVEPEPGQPGWTYTIGLLASYDHPELLIVDDDVNRGASLLNSLGRAIRDGATLEPGDDITLGGCATELLDIHPVHLDDGVMGLWRILDHLGPDGEPLPLEAYQVVMATVPGGGRLPDVRLDVPVPALYRTGPNRAQRRAAARRRHT